MLLALIIIPIIGVLIISIINSQNISSDSISKIGLLTSVINFIVSIIILILFDFNCSQFQFISGNWLGCTLGIDGISLVFILLTTFITPICLLSQWGISRSASFQICFLITSSLLILVFSVLDLLIFYIAFESVLIPMFLIIGLFGARRRKIHAVYYFFLYTLLGSLFMLLSIIFIYMLSGTTDFISLTLIEFSVKTQCILWLGFFLSFAVKTPLVPFHIWLAEAHCESPVSGSVILAGLLLKLATYGFLRFSLVLFPDALIYFTPIVLMLAVISIIYSSLSTLRQIDLKKIIAYSSIGHMSICILGIFSNTIVGISGAIILSLAHGVVSPALFLLVTNLYDRTGTRIIKYYRGIIQTAPLLSIMFFLFTLGNIGTPLSANFIGEILCLMGVFKLNPILASLGGLSLILSASYGIWLYNRIIFGGSFGPYLIGFNDLTLKEFVILIPLIAIQLILGIAPNIILEYIHLPISGLIY